MTTTSKSSSNLDEHGSKAETSAPNDSDKTSSDSFITGAHHVQTYVYLGYAYILLMGIANDSIFYGFLGINIISYSNVLDVILSPLVHLIDNVILMGLIVGTPILAYLYIKLIRYAVPKIKRATKLALHDLVVGDIKKQIVVMTAIMIFSGFIGFGVGSGNKTSRKLEQKKLKPNHEISFKSGDSKKVHLIGSNSGFVFYVENESDVVSISPMQENIVVIKKIKED